MKIYHLHREIEVPRPREELFGFFAEPANLARLTPSSLGFQILTPDPIVMREGTLIDYVVRLAGWPVRWTTAITCYEPPERFVDVQLRGPYDFWHHTHTFEETAGGTRLVDEVRYAMPLRPIGRLAHGLWVSRQLDGIFAHRAAVIRELFE